jgi:hypothetical protein
MNENPYKSPESGRERDERSARDFPDFSPETYRVFWETVFWLLVASIPLGILVLLARYD